LSVGSLHFSNGILITKMDLVNSAINVLKEPRGFIRVLQFVFAIVGFATTTNFGGSFGFTVRCDNSSSQDVAVSKGISYPFRLDHEKIEVDACGKNFAVSFFGDYSSDSQFFVTSGVLAMLYSVGAIAVYSVLDNLYKADRRFPLVDFWVTTAVAVFWLSASAAWASGLNSLKYTTDPVNIVQYLDICKVNHCVSYFAANFADLNISIIIGFLNFFLWTVNLWFLYKETSWFLENGPSAGTDSGLPPPGP